MIGRVSHVYAQWHRSGGWSMKADKPKEQNWRLFREFSGGLTAELASHQIDVADWMIGSTPEFVVGVGGLDFVKDGRDVYDNIQLIYKYPKGERLMYSSISTNKHLSLFYSQRTEFGEMIMGTEGTIHITVGTDNEPALGLWFREPSGKATPAPATSRATAASASLTSTGAGQKGYPILLAKDQVGDSDSFLAKEMKFARRWLYSKGVMVPEETKNPVDTQLESFFECVRTGKKPVADLEVGLADSTAVMLSNLAMDEGRRVYFGEIEKMGKA
jgi:predicted dehydrogenase